MVGHVMLLLSLHTKPLAMHESVDICRCLLSLLAREMAVTVDFLQQRKDKGSFSGDWAFCVRSEATAKLAHEE